MNFLRSCTVSAVFLSLLLGVHSARADLSELSISIDPALGTYTLDQSTQAIYNDLGPNHLFVGVSPTRTFSYSGTFPLTRLGSDHPIGGGFFDVLEIDVTFVSPLLLAFPGPGEPSDNGNTWRLVRMTLGGPSIPPVVYNGDYEFGGAGIVINQFTPIVNGGIFGQLTSSKTDYGLGAQTTINELSTSYFYSYSCDSPPLYFDNFELSIAVGQMAPPNPPPGR